MGSIADTEGSVQMFVERDAALGEGITPGGRRDLPASVAELHAVIVAHRALMLDGEDAVELIPEVGDESGPLSSRSNRPGAVMERDPGVLQEGIGCLQGGDSGQAQFLGQPALPGFPEAFHASPGLGGVGGDELDADLGQRPFNLGWAGGLLGLMRASAGASGHEVARPIGV